MSNAHRRWCSLDATSPEVQSRILRERYLDEELAVQAAGSGDLQSLISMIVFIEMMGLGDESISTWYEAVQLAAGNGHASIVQYLLDKPCGRDCAWIAGRGSGGRMTRWRFQEGSMSRWRFQEDSMSRWHFHGLHMTTSPLHLAVKHGHLHVVQHILHFFLKPELRQYRSKKWFQGLVDWAVRWGHAPIVQLLLTPPLLVNDDYSPRLTLHLAAHHNHLAVLQLLLQISTDSALPFSSEAPMLSTDGLTPLHLAAQSGCSSAVKVLVNEAKMDVNARSHPEFFTPLHMAANSGHVEVVSFLLQESLKTDIVHAPELQASCPSTTFSLIMARDCMGRTALHYAAREGHEAVVQLLLNWAEQNHVQSNIASIADNDGILPWHMVAREGHVGCVKILKSFTGGVNDSKAGYSLNMKRRVEMEYMVRKKANIYYEEECKFPRPRLIDSFFWKTEGFTPLHLAARYGHEAVVRELQLKESNVLDLHTTHTQVSLPCASTIVEEQKPKGELAFPASGAEDSRGICKRKIDEEKKAMEELRHAWEKGTRPPLRMNIVQWLEEEEIGIRVTEFWLSWAVKQEDTDLLKILLGVLADFQAADRDSSHGNWGVQPLEYDEAVRKAFYTAVVEQNFTAAKEILLLAPDLVSVDDWVAQSIVKRLEQWSDSIKYTKERRCDILDFLMVVVTREGLVGASSLLRQMLPWAKKHGFHDLVRVILDRPELKKGLYEDRQVYLDCANAILVGAALIAGVAFQAWLQPPLGYNNGFEGEEYAEVQKPMVRLFWRSNNGAFFLAVGALLAGAKGAVPVARDIDIVKSVEKVKSAVAMASTLMGMAVVCVVVAFMAAGFAVLPPPPSDAHHMMRNCVGWGGTICGLALLWFYSSVLPLIIISHLLPLIISHVRAILGCLLFLPAVFLFWVLFWVLEYFDVIDQQDLYAHSIAKFCFHKDAVRVFRTVTNFFRTVTNFFRQFGPRVYFLLYDDDGAEYT